MLHVSRIYSYVKKFLSKYLIITKVNKQTLVATTDREYRLYRIRAVEPFRKQSNKPQRDGGREKRILSL